MLAHPAPPGAAWWFRAAAAALVVVAALSTAADGAEHRPGVGPIRGAGSRVSPDCRARLTAARRQAVWTHQKAYSVLGCEPSPLFRTISYHLRNRVTGERRQAAVNLPVSMTVEQFTDRLTARLGRDWTVTIP